HPYLRARFGDRDALPRGRPRAGRGDAVALPRVGQCAETDPRLSPHRRRLRGRAADQPSDGCIERLSYGRGADRADRPRALLTLLAVLLTRSLRGALRSAPDDPAGELLLATGAALVAAC